MDPLSALAIVTAVFQLTEFGVKFLSKGIARYKDARARSDELRAIQQELSALEFNLQRVCDEVNGKNGFSRPQLVKILGECESLTSEIQLMVPEDGGELPLSLWTGSKTASLRQRFGKVQSMATEAIIVSMWESNKNIERREIQFGRQMNELLQSFKLLEERLRQRDAQAPDQGPPAVLDPSVLVQIGGRSGGLNIDQGAASETMRGFFDSGEPIPCSEMEIEIRKSLSQGFMSLPLRIRIWRRGWSLDDYDADAPGLVSADGANVKSVAARAAARFKFEAIEARQNAVSDSILQTYTWIYDRESPPSGDKPSWSSFPKWLESANQPIYWITGKPGSGKSTIMKHIIRSPSLTTHLRNWSGHLPLLIAGYYAWNPGTDPLQKTLEGLKRTILCQALTKFPNLAPKLAPRVWAYYAILQYPQREQEVPLAEEWEIDESFQVLISLAGKEFSLFIFIDGLDEFEIHPKTTVSLVESLISSTRHVKICVASRPWVEFDDTYRDMPKLRMDQVTGNDLATFVRERFRTCRGFEDLRNLHPVEATELLRDITEKAKGVFIWVKVVVDSLIESITEGCGMKDLQDIVASLPTDIKNLYETLWARTPGPSKNRAAILLRLSNTEFWPLNWTEAWLADEYALRSFDVSREELGGIGTSGSTQEAARAYIEPLLRRKLASRTRGLLEVASQGYVDFSHRTAHDWAKQPAVQEEVANICGGLRHDPYLFLAQLLTIQVSRLALCPRSRSWFWADIVIRALRCASRATLSSEEDVQSLVKTLDTFDQRCGVILKQMPSTNDIPKSYLDSHWASLRWHQAPQSGNPSPLVTCWRTNTFIGLAAQFHILRYIKAKVAADPLVLIQPGTAKAVGIFESAVLGYDFFVDLDKSVAPMEPEMVTPIALRIKTVQYLLDQGVGQSDTYFQLSGPIRRGDLKILVSKCAALHQRENTRARELSKYYIAVGKLLSQHSRLARWRSFRGWLGKAKRTRRKGREHN